MRRYWAALACALCLLPVLLALEFPLAPSAPANSAAFPYEAQDAVDLNSANAGELCLLPGIGEKRAAAIVAYRDSHGPFTQLEQLDEVDGISRRMALALEPYVTLG